MLVLFYFSFYPQTTIAGKEVADNVAVINATDLSPMIEHTQVKEIREVVVPSDPETKQNRPVEVSLRVAELPTTTPIEVTICCHWFFAEFTHCLSTGLCMYVPKKAVKHVKKEKNKCDSCKPKLLELSSPLPQHFLSIIQVIRT